MSSSLNAGWIKYPSSRCLLNIIFCSSSSSSSPLTFISQPCQRISIRFPKWISQITKMDFSYQHFAKRKVHLRFFRIAKSSPPLWSLKQNKFALIQNINLVRSRIQNVIQLYRELFTVWWHIIDPASSNAVQGVTECPLQLLMWWQQNPGKMWMLQNAPRVSMFLSHCGADYPRPRVLVWPLMAMMM